MNRKKLIMRIKNPKQNLKHQSILSQQIQSLKSNFNLGEMFLENHTHIQEDKLELVLEKRMFHILAKTRRILR